jgi:hypothetical protein
MGSVEWPFAVTRKAYALVFINNLLTEVRATNKLADSGRS